MKMAEAQNIMHEKNKFIVSFEVRTGAILRSDHFPEIRIGELPIASYDEAVKLAKTFAEKTKNKRIVNVHVCYAHNFSPVNSQTFNSNSCL